MLIVPAAVIVSYQSNYDGLLLFLFMKKSFLNVTESSRNILRGWVLFQYVKVFSLFCFLATTKEEERGSF